MFYYYFYCNLLNIYFYDIELVTTSSPLAGNTDEELEGVTTENTQNDEIPETTYPSTFTDKKDRMVINVVTCKNNLGCI